MNYRRNSRKRGSYPTHPVAARNQEYVRRPSNALFSVTESA